MKDKEYPSTEQPVNLLKEDMDALYEKASLDMLRNSLKSTYTERFLLATRLYKIQQMLSKAKITHKPFNTNK